MGIHQKTDEKTLLGTTFLGKHQIWGDFGVPGRSLGKALGRILGRNFGGGKHDEKTVVSVVASAGNADPGKEGFREDSQVGEVDRSNTPSLILTDGRADCLRFASPAEATWRLETWKSMRIDEKTMKILHWRPGTRVSGAVLWCPGQFGGWSLGNQ